MKHEVKIPSDCKATVSIEDRRILIIIDQKEDILVAGTNHIQAFAGQFVKSDAGYIAMTGEQNYTVILTPSGEIQLNQSCNFPITIPAKFNDADKLMTELAKQKSPYDRREGISKVETCKTYMRTFFRHKLSMESKNILVYGRCTYG